MSEEVKYSEELKRRIEESKRKAMEEEVQRIGKEIEQRGNELAKSRLESDKASYAQELKAAESERLREVETLRNRMEEVGQKLNKEKKNKEDARRRAKEELRRKQEEEIRQREAAEKEKKEQEARREAEEKQRRLAEEAKRKAEEQRRRQEEELRRAEEERLRKELERKEKIDEERRRLAEETRQKEEERRRQIEEKENRIRSLIANANMFYNNKEYENASVEVAKALVNNPSHPEALELERKIRDILGKSTTEEVVEKSKVKEVTPVISRTETEPKKKTLPIPLIALLIFAGIAVGVVIILQLKKHVFEKPPAIAVMPWKSNSNTEEETVAGFSLPEEIAQRFQHLPDANVMGYSSSSGLASSIVNADREIYRLGYDYILQGTVSGSNDVFSIDLKLVDSLGQIKWTKRYQEKASSLPEVTDKVAKDIAEALKIPVGESGAPSMNHHTSVNAEAYSAYLHGIAKLRQQTDLNTKEALDLFKTAIDRDGKFAEAMLAAINVAMMRIEKGWDTGDENISLSKQWQEQAIVANTSLMGESYAALGNMLMQRHEFKSALTQFDAAAKLLPNCSDVYLGQAKIYLRLGKYDDALSALDRAYNLNARDPEVLRTFALAHQLQGSVEEGFWYHMTALYFVPDSLEYLVGPVADAILFEPALSLSHSGRVANACQQRFTSNPNDYVAMYRLGRMTQVNGNGVEALAILNSLEGNLQKIVQAQPKNTGAMMYLALTLTRLGKYPEAVALANKALSLEGGSAEVKYKIAEMYSVQMYSYKKKEIDPNKKAEALKSLHEAVGLNFQLDELTDADFYNLHSQPEFRTAIAQK